MLDIRVENLLVFTCVRCDNTNRSEHTMPAWRDGDYDYTTSRPDVGCTAGKLKLFLLLVLLQ